MGDGKSWDRSQTGPGAERGGGVDEIAWTPRLGAHLEASRKNAKLRRLDLAAQLQVSEETIRLWEKGAVQPSAERLARLIALLALETTDWPADPGPSLELAPLARRLRTEREGRGLTQASVVKVLGVPQATYAGWETGRSTPGAHHFPRLASFLGIAEPDVVTLCASPFIVDHAAWPAFGQFVGGRRQELRLTRAMLAEALGRVPGNGRGLGARLPGARLEAPHTLAHVLSVDTASLAAALPRRGDLDAPWGT